MSSREGWHLIFMEEKICSFFGHREISITDKLCAALKAEILNAVDMGFRTFYFGGYGAFDSLCHKTVTEIKEENPAIGIKRVYCVSQERYLRKPLRYFNREDYDEIIYPNLSFEGWYKSIYFRNCAMIDSSGIVIFYAQNKKNSGAYKAYKYAMSKKGKQIINLFE